jgi:hypothetical protein
LAHLTLFHGNTEKVIDDTIAAGKCLSQYKSTGPKHYLGDGYYFYDDPEQARIWALMKVTRNPIYLGQPWAVLKCEVEVEDGKIFDLDKRKEQDFFFEEMLKIHIQIQSGDLEVECYRDTYLCNHLANILGIEMFTKTFPYKDKKEIVTPIFSNVRPKEFPITRHFRTEKQYCFLAK